MKVLYIGCYRDHTGWGQAAIDYILSMDSVGIDVVCRPLKLNQTQGGLTKTLPCTPQRPVILSVLRGPKELIRWTKLGRLTTSQKKRR